MRVPLFAHQRRADGSQAEKSAKMGRVEEAIERSQMVKPKTNRGRSLCVLLAVAVGLGTVGLGSAIGSGDGAVAKTGAISVAAVIER